MASHFNRKVLLYFLPNVILKSKNGLLPKFGTFKADDGFFSGVSVQRKMLCFSPVSFSEKKYQMPGIKIIKVMTEDGVKEVKKKLYEERVTLLAVDGSIQDVVSLDEANKLARRRNLKLIKVSDKDPKTDRAVYKLLTSSDILQGTKNDKGKKGSGSKDEKHLNVNANITEHDLQSKIKHLLKWLEKEYTIRVIILGDPASGEKVYNVIEDGVKDAGRIVQKVVKAGEIKFQVLLPKKPKIKPPIESSNPSEESTIK